MLNTYFNIKQLFYFSIPPRTPCETGNIFKVPNDDIFILHCRAIFLTPLYKHLIIQSIFLKYPRRAFTYFNIKLFLKFYLLTLFHPSRTPCETVNVFKAPSDLFININVKRVFKFFSFFTSSIFANASRCSQLSATIDLQISM